eukprot:365249-Chlamydomonas_euryale.AAC.26
MALPDPGRSTVHTQLGITCYPRMGVDMFVLAMPLKPTAYACGHCVLRRCALAGLQRTIQARKNVTFDGRLPGLFTAGVGAEVWRGVQNAAPAVKGGSCRSGR